MELQPEMPPSSEILHHLVERMSHLGKLCIHKRLCTNTYPDMISGELVLKHDTQVSESTIYRYIWATGLMEGNNCKC